MDLLGKRITSHPGLEIFLEILVGASIGSSQKNIGMGHFFMVGCEDSEETFGTDGMVSVNDIV